MSPLASALLFGILAGTPADVIEIELRDQYGRSDSLAAHRGETVVVMVVTARRLRNLKGWERDLRERMEDLRFLRVVDIPEDPPVTHQEVADKLSKRVPDDIAVLIDIERRWARTLALDTARPNLLLFDSAGKLVRHERGRYDAEVAAKLAAEIEALAERP